ncbi:hypothetical protein OIDMADRAFT_48838 [Oidiodendron maius Zn]|uniref:Uncharacterized protein n=1 Tax=Oidiodendron maius (strain Zn) TaxID=913774 RepID=A0A0C3I3N9_OIDMZ|nr:hypothetical protein OIDMADRAFT_48838 [Oidiodendron maius Zn]
MSNIDCPTSRPPRRHAQRKALVDRWARSPTPGLPNPEYPGALCARKRNRKRGSATTSDDKSSGSGPDFDPDSEHKDDLGYNFDSSDTKAEYLKDRLSANLPVLPFRTLMRLPKR